MLIIFTIQVYCIIKLLARRNLRKSRMLNPLIISSPFPRNQMNDFAWVTFFGIRFDRSFSICLFRVGKIFKVWNSYFSYYTTIRGGNIIDFWPNQSGRAWKLYREKEKMYRKSLERKILEKSYFGYLGFQLGKSAKTHSPFILKLR